MKKVYVIEVHGPLCDGKCMDSLKEEMGSSSKSSPATEAYRQGWETIFGKRAEVGQA